MPDPDKHLPAPIETHTDLERTKDRYEAEYMQADGMVLFRIKDRAPWQLGALIGGAGALAVGSSVLAGSYASLLAIPIILSVLLLFSVLRVTVSQGTVNIQYGLFGPKIPMAAIESAEATTYDWKRFGGWGIRRSVKGEWIYNMPNDGGNAVRITWRNKKGKRVVTLVGTREAQNVAAAIAKAQRMLPAGEQTPALPPT